MDTQDKIRETYNKHAEKYAWLREHPEYMFFNSYIENPAMLSLLEDIDGKDVLDIGCGSGIFTRQLSDLGAKVIGVDFAYNFIKIAAPGKYYVAKASELPFTEMFDIVSSNLMVHYYEDQRDLFSEVYRVLKPNGKFIFSTGHPVFEMYQADSEIFQALAEEKETKLSPYFRNKKEFSWTLKDENRDPIFEMPAYRQNFQDITNALYDSGFGTDIINEPQPIEEGKEVNPMLYEAFSKFPSFIVVQARRL